MIARSNLFTTQGGDTIQINQTATHLRAMGITVDICKSNEFPQYNNYDVIHFFNIIRPDDILPHIRHTVPFVVSSIFVDYSEFDKLSRKGISGLIFRFLAPGQIEYLKSIARWIKNGDSIKSISYLLKGQRSSIKHILSKTKLLLPNSENEYNRLYQYLPFDSEFRKVVNAIDPSVFTEKGIVNAKFKDHVICVARIEGLKNQLNLIKALINTNIPLSIIGKPSPNHQDYFEECKKVASGAKNIQFIDHISHTELVAIYRAAKVHVLPSWFETTGLSSLEAAAMGCNIVISPKGDTREYFKDMAYYCDPGNVDSIRKAVFNAYQNEPNPQLKTFILENYTWEKAASQTLAAYNHVLNSIK